MSDSNIAIGTAFARRLPARLRDIPNLMTSSELPDKVVCHPAAQLVPVLQRLVAGRKSGLYSMQVYRRRRRDSASRSQRMQELRDLIDIKASALESAEIFASGFRYEIAMLRQQLQALEVAAAVSSCGVAHGP